ncbi:MAG: response regulator [Lachnospiraceae bacterium]|nr:response regulator [Lachnospiraceae bacterium]
MGNELDDDLLADLNLFDFWNDGEQDSAEQVSATGDVFGSIAPVAPVSAVPASETGRLGSSDPERDFVNAIDDMVIPQTHPQKAASEKPMVVVIDDDFNTLDLMKIYLQREYEYVSFDNAREAIFYLNKQVPDLIFLDCYMSVVRAQKMVEIIKSYPDYADVPIYLVAEQDERGAMEAKLQKEGFPGVSGILTRPIARGALQKVLDEVFHKGEETDSADA